MKRLSLALGALGVLAVLTSSACKGKPTDAECRAAISNMEKVLGTEALSRNTDTEGEVRRCRGGSSKAAVTCAAKAATLEDLKACAFMTPKTPSAAPAEPTVSPAAPPAAPPAPPAAGSSAAAGSAAADGSGAPAGSAPAAGAAPAAGSAAAAGSGSAEPSK